MSNQKPGFRFRMPSWFAPASASSSPPPPPKKSSNQPASTSPSTIDSKSRTGTAPQDSTADQKAPVEPQGKVAQNLNSQSNTKPDSPSEARIASQARPDDKPASPTKLNNQTSNPTRGASQPKVQPVQLSPTASPQLPSTSKEPSQARAKPEKNIDHESKSTEEATNGSEIKSTNEVVSNPSSPKTSPQLETKDTPLVPTSKTEPTSAIDEKPVAPNSPDQAKVTTHDEIKRRPKEQTPTSRADSESPLPTLESNSSNMNHEREKISESHLNHEEAEQMIAKDQDTTDKELEKEKKVIDELQREESGSEKYIKETKSVAVQPIHSNNDMKKNDDESLPGSKQNQSANKPRHNDSNDPAAFKGKEFPINNVSKHNKAIIKTPGDQGYSREEKPTSVITLAGDNRGATMEIGSRSSGSAQGLHIHRGYNHNHDESNISATDTEEIPNKIDSDTSKPVDDHGPDMYINSNLQCINNAIMLNSSITERDPGVHVVPSHALEESNKKANTKNVVTHKAEINRTNAKKVIYEPDGSSSSIAKGSIGGMEWF